VRSALVVGVVCLAGCSLLVPLDAASGGDDSDASTAGGNDASSNDATTNDGSSSGNPSDSGNDATSNALVCPTNALLCDDFERAELANANWVVDGLAISSALAYSPTRSVTLNDQANAWHNMQHTLTTTPLHLRVSFRFHAGGPPPGLVELAKIPFGAPYQWDSATLNINDGGLDISLQNYTGNPGPTNTTTLNVADANKFYGAGFRHVVWEMDMRAATKHASASVDGSAPVAVQIAGHAAAPPVPNLLMGTLYRNQDGPVVDTYIDDVVVEPL
jgi:hypothetical protein